jgi:hypothetical protein
MTTSSWDASHCSVYITGRFNAVAYPLGRSGITFRGVETATPTVPLSDATNGHSILRSASLVSGVFDVSPSDEAILSYAKRSLLMFIRALIRQDCDRLTFENMP